MKKILIVLVVMLSVFIAAGNIFAKSNNDNFKATDIGRPYICVVVETNGNITREIKGISANTDPYAIAQDLGAGPFAEDRMKAFPDIKMGIGAKITLYRAPVINITDGKRSKVVRSWKRTVGELLEEQKIEIGQDDRINFASDIEITDQMEIKIIRVAITTVIESQAIEYESVKKLNPNVEKGNKKILQVGKNGTLNKFYEVRREDGEEISRKLLKTEVAVEPTDEIIEYGTKVVVYGSGVASVWKESGAMIAACNFVARGTKVHVVNISNSKSVDVICQGGGLRNDRIIDLSDAAFEALGGSWSVGLLKNIRVEKWYPEE